MSYSKGQSFGRTWYDFCVEQFFVIYLPHDWTPDYQEPKDYKKIK